MPAAKNKLIRYLSAFFASEVLMFLGSFVSFPIFTRIFSKTDYGTMSLIGITIALAGYLTSLGMKDAVQRFYSSYVGEEKKEFLSSIINFFILISLLVIGLMMFFVCLFQDKIVFWGSYDVSLVLLASSLIIFRGVFAIISTAFRMEEKIRTVIFFDFLQRYVGLIFSVFLVILYKDLFGYYWGLVASEGLLTVIMLYLVRKNLSFPLIKKKYIVSSVRYGFPLSMSNISTFLLSFGDRYAIGFLLGPAAVGVYSVAYNLCNYIFELIKNIFFKTFMPLVINNWNKDEISQSQKTLSLHFRFYLMLTMPCVFGLTAVGTDALTLLAGAKYQEAFFLVPVLASAIAVNGLSAVTFSGMYYKSQSLRILIINLSTAILNLVLNLTLLPQIGLVGAAWATGISYFLMVLSGYFYTKQSLKINYQIVSVIKYVGFSFLMFDAIKLLPFSGNMGLLLKIMAGVLLYTVMIMLFDFSFLRKKVLNFREGQP